MEGCIEWAGLYLDVEKIATALQNGSLTKPGSSCVSHEAREVAMNMVDGAVCGTKITDWCEDCPALEEAESKANALIGSVADAVDDLKIAVKQEDWDTVGRVLQNLEALL